MTKNYLIVYFNESSHNKSSAKKTSQLKAFFSWAIKSICFLVKNHLMGFIYFVVFMAAIDHFQSCCYVSNSCGFQVPFGADRAIGPFELKAENIKPRTIIGQNNHTAEYISNMSINAEIQSLIPNTSAFQIEKRMWHKKKAPRTRMKHKVRHRIPALSLISRLLQWFTSRV